MAVLRLSRSVFASARVPAAFLVVFSIVLGALVLPRQMVPFVKKVEAAPVAIPIATSLTQNFDGIGTSATATLPADFKVDRPTTVRTVGSYAAAGTATTAVGGASLSSSASNGTYNFGSGTTTTGSDRAIGFLSSSGGTQSGNLYVQLVNNTGGGLSGLNLSYDVEKYRAGTNAAGFRIQLYYSTDGSTWTSAGSSFLTSFAADAATAGYSPAPGSTVNVSAPLNVAIPNNTNFYVAWNYSVSSGTTTTNAQALAIDNISIQGVSAGGQNNPPTINAPADPITTVGQDIAPFNVSLAGSDDNNVYNWSAAAGTGVSSVVVSSGQGTSNATFTVTLQLGFTGTASFTASLSDNVNTPATTQIVNIKVNPVVMANNPPTITAPANPIATVAQDAGSFNVDLAGSDDGNIYNWSATAGLGVLAVSVVGGQGTPNVTYSVTVQSGFNGTATFNAVLSDNVNAAVSQPVNINVTPAPASHVVISQIYGGGGNSNAPYTNDYVELFNPTSTTVSITGWTLQYASATGTTWTNNNQPLGGSIAPGEYYLVQLASGGVVGQPLPTQPNIAGSINMSGTTGKIALVNNGEPLTGVSPGCPLDDPDLVDFVGYGTSATCHEGAANAPAPSNTTALFRINSGNTDTNMNNLDFVTATPGPRRTSPIVELGPWVASTDPTPNDTVIPHDDTISVNFSEPVDVDGGWFDITCAATGSHDSATVAHTSDFKTYLITPNVNFNFGEQCAVKINKAAIHDQDIDDSAQGTDTLPDDYSWSFTVVAAGDPAPYPPGVHLTMGDPGCNTLAGCATADVNNPNNYLMEKPTYALSYNRDKGTPNWVSWHLDSSWYGTLARVDTFRADPAVPADWYRVEGTDYSFSGFDRGHMTPNADRDNQNRIPINQETYLMSNMVPQAPDNNQGPWANLENYLRTLTSDTTNPKELYIVSGPAGVGGSGSNGGTTTTIAGGHVTVPAYTWKVVLVLPKSDGDDISRVTAATRAIAVIMPNTQGIRTNNPNDWQAYLKSVNDVEALTGYDFFANLPDDVENSIEAGVNGVNPPGAGDQSVQTSEDTAVQFKLDAVDPNDAALTSTIKSAPKGSLSCGGGVNCTYTPPADFNGTDTFQYSVSNGTSGSNTATVTIGVSAVNDAPSFTKGSDQTVSEDSGSKIIAGWATAISSGPSDESGQTVSFVVLNDNNALFSTQPSVSPSGTLTFTPAANASGSAVVTVAAHDNGGTAGGGVDTSAAQTFAIAVTAVNDAPTVSNDGVPQSVQYSDAIQAVHIIGTDVDSPLLQISTSFAKDSEPSQAGLPKGLTLSGNCTANAVPLIGDGSVCTWTISGTASVAPGSYDVTANVSDDGTAVSTSFTIVVTQEDARATYTGAQFAATSGPSSNTAKVTLAATVQDISAIPGDPDMLPGDIRNATVTFMNRDNGDAFLCSASIGLVDVNDAKAGTATCNWTADIGTKDSQSFTVGVVVDGSYSRNAADDDTVVTVSKPVPGLVSGGGYLLLANSGGQRAGDAGTKNNFGFNIKNDKNGPKGTINVIVRRLDSDRVIHVYQIKGNVMTSLSTNLKTTSLHPNPTAVFNGRANIQDITDPLNVVSIDGNASLQVVMTDGGDADSIAITLWDKSGGLWFASSWDGAKTVEQSLGGGNLQVR